MSLCAAHFSSEAAVPGCAGTGSDPTELQGSLGMEGAH